MNVKEILHFNGMGISLDLYDFLNWIQPESVVCPISANNLRRLLKLRGVDVNVVSEHEYYLYWKSQPSGGYNTTITYDDREFTVSRTEPDPRYGVLCVCAWEIIVFRLDEATISR